MWQAALLIICSAHPSTSCCGPAGCRHTSAAANPTAWKADSANFRVEIYAAGWNAQSIAECCESWRTQLQTKWLGRVAEDGWNPKCQIVIHASRPTYRAAIGRGGEQTFGSSIVDLAGGRISRRRIDLLIDAQGTISALGHELTHVVMADAFPSTQPPAWAGEGAAVLADSASKQRLHRRDLDQSLTRQASFSCAELLSMSQYPPPHRIAAFYGQSASVTEFLASLNGPDQLIPFLMRAREKGYDAALRHSYGIHSLAELDRRWREQLSAAISGTTGSAAEIATSACGD